MEPSRLLQLYRRDRRKLLEFVLFSRSVRAPLDAGFDLDTVSIDYVLERIQTGGVLDLSEATKRYYDELNFPIMINSPPRDSFFLCSNGNTSGSPPHRYAPEIRTNVSYHSTYLTKQPAQFCGTGISGSGIGTDLRDQAATVAPCHPGKDADIFSLGLPKLGTGLSDDDVRETAYEVLLASVILSGVQVHVPEERKMSRYFKGLRPKRDGSNSRSQPADILDIIRVQMEVSEVMDACIRQGLRRLCSRMMMNEKIDVPQISLELLTNVSKSDFTSEKSYIQWHKRQVNILEELLHCPDGLVTDGHKLSILLSKLRDTKEWIPNIGYSGHAEVLTALRGFASSLSNLPGKFGIPGETYYWADGYHLNLRLYEKLLSGVFDTLEDTQVVEEAEEILMVYKLTWPTLGITKKIHDTMFAWVLFQQFTHTGEVMLLKFAVVEVRKVISGNDDGPNKGAYVSSLICSTGTDCCIRELSLLDAVLYSIKLWSSCQLEDYHLHFNEDKSIIFENMVNLAILLEEYLADKCRDDKTHEFDDGISRTSKLLHSLVEKSIQASYKRVLNFLDMKSKTEKKHPLAVLGEELKLIAMKESTVFAPVLFRHYPQARNHSSILMHQLYGKQLRPFLESVSDLSEGVRPVLAAADSLEHYLTKTLGSMCGDGAKSVCDNSMQPYKIRDVCRPLILHWVNAQHCNLLEWTKRAVDLEEWEPLSSQQRQAASIVEVFRIIEETINQFFNLDIPMDTVHLRSLLIGIVRSLETYLLHMASEQVDKKNLYPNPPALTRYEGLITPFLKKKSAENIVLEESVTAKRNHLTASKLCVKLNTLYYIKDQLDALEESIQNSWLLFCAASGRPTEELSMNSESVDELFTLFDDIRRSTINTTDDIIDFIGARVIFWDLRDSFLYSIYKGNVGGARLEMFLPQLDGVLDSICGLILDILRDQVVLSICRASMDGYVWVMLDGGPSRVFSETDVSMLQEDLTILKDLFIADGQGLPSVVVEKEARLAQQIIDLFALKAESIIEMLMSVSEQVSHALEHKKPRTRTAKDAYTLLRVLCHKKDKEASKYLKVHYQLPKSSDYEDNPLKEPTSKSPILPEIFRKNSSFDWTERGQRSFRTIKQKFHEATSEMKYAPW